MFSELPDALIVINTSPERGHRPQLIGENLFIGDIVGDRGVDASHRALECGKIDARPGARHLVAIAGDKAAGAGVDLAGKAHRFCRRLG